MSLSMCDSVKPPYRVLVVAGTRPEVIKLAPVVSALCACGPDVDVTFGVTGQHDLLLRQALEAFDLTPHFNLEVMDVGQSLPQTAGKCMSGIGKEISRIEPHAVVVQGDTSTTFATALAAYYLGVPIGHVEAGLRTGDLSAPFPEEMNRVLTSRLARWHFCPTDSARAALIAEGHDPAGIFVTGNTVIDALQQIQVRLSPLGGSSAPHIKTLLVTMHRRENWGEPIRQVCRALRDVLSERPDVCVDLVMHGNPAVQSDVRAVLSGVSRLRLLEPPGYVEFVDLMRRSYAVLTDSGGIQEEAPALGKPVLILRERTERPEGVTAGVASLVGTATSRVRDAVLQLLDDSSAYERMTSSESLYGDGTASVQIAQALVRDLENRED